MTQAPKRIRVIRSVAALSGAVREFIVSDRYRLESRDTEHFYTLEENMTQEEPKTMTARDAWIAMADGKCVKSSDGIVRRIGPVSQVLHRWQDDARAWELSNTIGPSPYSIVPDPSKPEVGEYEKDILTVGNQIAHAKTNEGSYGDQCLRMALQELFGLLQKHYVRKPEM